MKVTIRFYEELNGFLDKKNQKKDIESGFNGTRSVKDLIESFGVPHVEVDLILVNGKPVDFTYLTEDGDRISVYPVFERLNIAGVQRLRDIPLRDIKFACDIHLRGLARRLRLLGFDVYHAEKRDDDGLVRVSAGEGRVILTGSRQLLMRRGISRGLCIKSSGTEKQITEVLERLDLKDRCDPFTRCIECNGLIEEMNKEDVKANEHIIPPGVRQWCGEFYRCRDCGRIYWRGSHYEKLVKFIEKILYNGNSGTC